MKDKTPIMVIDHTVSECFIYDMDSDLLSEDIESKLIAQGHHLSSCSWGQYNGIINDKRD